MTPLPEELLKWWKIHEDLCDIWSDDDDWDQTVERFREYIKPLFNDSENVSLDMPGEYARAMFIYAFRDWMRENRG